MFTWRDHAGNEKGDPIKCFRRHLPARYMSLNWQKILVCCDGLDGKPRSVGGMQSARLTWPARSKGILDESTEVEKVHSHHPRPKQIPMNDLPILLLPAELSAKCFRLKTQGNHWRKKKRHSIGLRLRLKPPVVHPPYRSLIIQRALI